MITTLYLILALIGSSIAILALLYLRRYSRQHRPNKIPHGITAAILLTPVAALLLYWQLGNPQAVDAKAAILQKANAFGDAVSALEKRLQDNPDNAQDWLLLGKSLLIMQQHEKAAAAFANHRRLAGDNTDALVGEAQARLVASSGTDPIIVTLLTTARLLESDNPAVLWLSGLQERLQGNYPQAIAYWQQALPLLATMAPERARIQGLIDEASGQMNEAITVIVHLLPTHQRQIKKDSTVFVFARAAGNAALPPLAASKLTAGELPATVVLDARNRMVETYALSDFATLSIVARLSRHGSVKATSGDLYGVMVSTSRDNIVKLTIDNLW